MKQFNSKEEVTKITHFLKQVFSKAGKQKGVIAWSGGIDSTVSLYLLTKVLPAKDITVLHLPYEMSHVDDFKLIAHPLKIPSTQFHTVSIRTMVQRVNADLKIDDSFRLGNVMARMRMIVLYDFAKKNNALVCGTENRTEELLGYFTRFGDSASDIEPICHLFKTQVYKLAVELKIPETFIRRSPSAELWDNQTDEGEFGFSYEEADAILSRYFDEKMTIEEIEHMGLTNVRKVIALAKKNSFKHEVPYSLG